MSYDIRVTHTKAQPTAEMHFKGRPEGLPSKFPAVFEEVAKYLGSRGLMTEGPAFAHYYPHEDAFDVQAGFAVPRPVEGEGDVLAGELPECDALTTTHMGSYERLMDAYEAIQAWAKDHGRKLAEGMWELYYSPPEAPESETRTDVVWPLEPS